MRSDRFDLKQSAHAHDRQLVGRDRKMVRPEMYQPLNKRCRRRQRRSHPRADQRNIRVPPRNTRQLASGLHVGLGSIFTIGIGPQPTHGFKIFGQIIGNSGARRRRRKRRRFRLILGKLRKQFGFGCGRCAVIDPSTKAETVAGLRGYIHGHSTRGPRRPFAIRV